MNKIKQNKLGIIIGSLALVTLMAIIYAVFTGTLNISGTANVRDSKWDIHIVESGQLEPSNTLSSSAKVLTKPTASGLSISDFNLSLTTPGDYIEYTFHGVNDGDYDATLSDLDKAGVTCTANGSTSDPEAVKVCNKLEYTLKYDNGSTVSEGDTLLSKETKTFVLKIKYQEFDDPTLLPTSNVSISGLGITLQYSQKGSARVNADGTTPYDPYFIGRELDILNEKYNVIEVGSDYVTLLKQKPLTKVEIDNNHYGQGYINKYTGGSAGEVYDISYWDEMASEEKYSGYGAIAYYSSATCGYNPPNQWNTVDWSGCTTDYDSSDIKHVVDDWANLTFTNGELTEVNGYRARLVKQDELRKIGYLSCTIDQQLTDIYCGLEPTTPSWMYIPYVGYWTMTSSNDDSDGAVWYVNYLGDLDNWPNICSPL